MNCDTGCDAIIIAKPTRMLIVAQSLTVLRESRAPHTWLADAPRLATFRHIMTTNSPYVHPVSLMSRENESCNYCMRF